MSAGGRIKVGNVDETGLLSPGAHLRAEIERLGLDQVAVSKATGVSRQSVNNIINGRQPISRAMAAKLGRLTGRSSDYWLSAFFSGQGTGHDKARRTAEATITGLLVNHQIIRAVKDGAIGVVPFDIAHVRAAALELTLDKTLTLAPGVVAATRTRERIELPLDYLGRIGIVRRLAGAGIIAAHAFQLEPGFKGRVDFSLFNAGSKAFRIGSTEAVIALEILRLTATPDGKIAT
jgi:addiction module HigA family antidote